MVKINIYANLKKLSESDYDQIKELAKKKELESLEYNNRMIDVHQNYLDNPDPDKNPLIGLVERLYSRVKEIHENSNLLIVDMFNVNGHYTDLFSKYDSKYMNYVLNALRLSFVYRKNRFDIVKPHDIMEQFYFGSMVKDEPTSHSWEAWEEQALEELLKIPSNVEYVGPTASCMELLDSVGIEVEKHNFKTFEFSHQYKLFGNRSDFEKFLNSSCNRYIVYSHAGMCANVVDDFNRNTPEIQSYIKDQLDMIYGKYPDAIIEIP